MTEINIITKIVAKLQEQMRDDSLAGDREDMMKLILGKVVRFRKNS